MACSALFLQRALYTVQCANIMDSRKPSFVITAPFLINNINRYLFLNIRGNEVRHILLKRFYLTTFDINNFKHPWFSPCTWRNKIMFNCRSVDLKKILSHIRALTVKLLVLRLWRHGVEWDGGVIAEVDNGWGECIGSDAYAWNVRFDSGLILFLFLVYFTIQI